MDEISAIDIIKIYTKEILDSIEFKHPISGWEFDLFSKDICVDLMLDMKSFGLMAAGYIRIEFIEPLRVSIEVDKFEGTARFFDGVYSASSDELDLSDPEFKEKYRDELIANLEAVGMKA
jgi:hypothetical protein